MLTENASSPFQAEPAHLFVRVKQHTRGREGPASLLSGQLPNRLALRHRLVAVGRFHNQRHLDTCRMYLGGENRLCYLEDLIEMLASAGVLIGHPSMVNTSETVDEILGLCDKDEAEYFRAVNQDTTYQPADGLIHQFEKDFRSVLGIMQKTTLNTYSMIDNSANTSAAR